MAYCLAKLQESSLSARKPKELIKQAFLNTQNRSRKEYPKELRSVDCYAINPDFQAMLQYDAHTVQWKEVGKAKNDNDIENMVFEHVKEEKDILAQVVIDSPKNFDSVLAGVEHDQTTKVTGEHGSDDVIKEDSVMVKVKFNHKCDNGSLEGHYLGRKFKNSRWLEGVKIGQPQSTIENTKIHMVRGMMWLALRYMKAKESEFILPHLRILRKLGLDEIRSMYLNELGKMSYVVGVTAGNKGLNMYQTCTTKRAKGVEVDAYHNDILALLLGSVEGVKEELIQEDGMDAGFAFLHYKTLNVIEFEWSFVPGVELTSLEMDYFDFFKSQHGYKIKIPSIAVAAYSFQERMIKNRLQVVEKWLVKWKWKKLCGRKKNFWKIGTNSRDPWGQGSFKGRVLLCVQLKYGVLYVLSTSRRLFNFDLQKDASVVQKLSNPDFVVSFRRHPKGGWFFFRWIRAWTYPFQIILPILQSPVFKTKDEHLEVNSLSDCSLSDLRMLKNLWLSGVVMFEAITRKTSITFKQKEFGSQALVPYVSSFFLKIRIELVQG
ncbi:hypothetical protein Tco_1194984 [Tanacetum coccineum]